MEIEKIIDLGNGYSFYHELLSVLPNGVKITDQLKKYVASRVTQRKLTMANCYGSTPIGLSIAPTGFCAGRCEYCYAKNFYNELDYLSVENMDKFIKKYNINLSKGNAIIYGGEPVYNFEKFKELVEYLLPLCGKGVSVVTSTFYDKATFEKLKDMYAHNKKLTLTISLDQPQYNLRKYQGMTPLESYEHAYKRFKEIAEIDPNGVSIRSTITYEKGYFDWIRGIEKDLGGKPLYHNCDYNTNCDGHPEELLKELHQYLDEKGPDYMYNNFYALDNYDSFIGIMKGCDVNISRLAVNHKGERIKCVDNLLDTDLPKTKEEMMSYVFNVSDKICEDCELKDLCLSKCFYVFNKSSCEWNYGIIREWLKRTAKRDLNSLIKKSVIQLVD